MSSQARNRTARKPKTENFKVKVVFSNPVLQRTYDALQENLLKARQSTPEESKAWMKRVCGVK